MKHVTKALLILCPLLALLAISCSDNPAVRMRYEAEKKLYQADKQTQRLQAFGQNLSPEQIRQVYPAYREAVDFCYSALDSIDPLAFPHETNELKYLTYESSTRLARLLLSA